MSKITALVPKTYQGNPSGFTVTFDDGRSGNMEEKQSDKGLRVGDDVVVTEIPYTSKKGVKSTLFGVRLNVAGTSQLANAPLTPPVVPPKPQMPTGVNNVSTAKANATVQAMRFVIDAFIADKINWDKIKEYHKEITGYLYDAIDECNS